MKKILATILAATALAATAPADDTSADVLVWYVDTEEARSGARNAAFDEIKFWAVNSDNSSTVSLGGLTYTSPEDLRAARYSDLSGGGPAGSGNSIPLGGTDTATGTYYTDLSSFQFDNGYSFLMELYNNNNGPVAWVEFPVSTSLAGIQEAIASLNSLVDSFEPVPMQGYNFGSAMTPEPTSGLLLLVGGALLALRRRRRA